MNNDVILTCAITGAGDTVKKNKNVPVTPEEIANSAIESAEAGASIVHIHVRDPVTGKGSRNPELFSDVVHRIRSSKTDVVINLTAGMGGDWVPDKKNYSMPSEGTDMVGPDERLTHVKKCLPEICSLDCGTLNFGDENLIYISTPKILSRMAFLIKKWKIKPELEVFDLGHIRLAKYLIEKKLIVSPPMFQICLGIPWGADQSTDIMKIMRDNLPSNSIWAGFGISKMQMPMVAASVTLGGNVRVGLEDNLYLEKGILANNTDLVKRAKKIIELIGGKVMSPADTRKKLNLIKMLPNG